MKTSNMLHSKTVIQSVKKVKSSTLFLGSLLLLSLQPVYVNAKEVKQQVSSKNEVTSLMKLLAPLKSIQAEFTQETKAGNVGKKPIKQRSGMSGLKVSNMNKKFSGSMVVKRPNKFFWHTQKPSEQKIIANGKTVWIYDPDLEQATQQKIDKQLANTPALLLSGNAKEISKNFKVSQPNKKRATFVLHPKSDDAVFKELAISFIKGKPRAMVLNDSLGQMTIIKFTKIMVNKSIADSKFNFKAPEGIDIIKQ